MELFHFVVLCSDEGFIHIIKAIFSALISDVVLIMNLSLLSCFQYASRML